MIMMKKVKFILIGCFAFTHLFSQGLELQKEQFNTNLNGESKLGKRRSGINKSNSFDLNVKLVRIKGGDFIMGDTNPRPDTPYYSDMPKHKVTLDDFYMAETEVTQALWKAIMNYNLSYYKGDSLPVYYISWNETQKFIAKLNQCTGKNYRLPTEAEWEYAAGGAVLHGSKFAGTSNDAELKDYAWIYENAGGKPHAVATKKPNALGLYDMTGNVWEWCSDILGAYPSTPQLNPKGSTDGYRRVSRGGSWLNAVVSQNLTLRGGYAPESSNNRYGFRLAMDAK